MNRISAKFSKIGYVCPIEQRFVGSDQVRELQSARRQDNRARVFGMYHHLRPSCARAMVVEKNAELVDGAVEIKVSGRTRALCVPL